MRAIYEFRVGEEDAQRYLEPGEGKPLGTSVRKLVVDSRDELFERVKRLQHQFREKGTFFFLGWDLRHEYTQTELAAAELFHLKIRAAFEPAGESCGTRYDETAGCGHCGVGARQLNELHLQPGSLPRGKDVAWTIACSEVVFSSRLVELLTRHGITGARFLPVRAKGSGAILPGWHQLEVTSRPLEVVEPTCFGVDPFDLDEKGEYRCPSGHVAGLNLLSQVWVKRDSHDGSDVRATRQHRGMRSRDGGIFRPSPLLLISPRLRHLLGEVKAKGFELEVAYLT
jgi:hypothetical protein